MPVGQPRDSSQASEVLRHYSPRCALCATTSVDARPIDECHGGSQTGESDPTPEDERASHSCFVPHPPRMHSVSIQLLLYCGTVKQELDLRAGAAFTRFLTTRIRDKFPTAGGSKVVSYGREETQASIANRT